MYECRVQLLAFVPLGELPLKLGLNLSGGVNFAQLILKPCKCARFCMLCRQKSRALIFGVYVHLESAGGTVQPQNRSFRETEKRTPGMFKRIARPSLTQLTGCLGDSRLEVPHVPGML